MISIAVEEEDDIAMPTEELDRYFLSPSANSTFFPISKHLEAVHKHHSGTFPMDSVVFA